MAAQEDGKDRYAILSPRLLDILRAYWRRATPLDPPLLRMAVNGAAGVLNALWCWVLITQGRKHHSPAGC
jgi:hypothetical protein